MKKLILILLALAGITSGYCLGYWEISNGVPSVFSASGSEQWRLWAGNDTAEALFNDSSGIVFSEAKQSIVVGKFTPGESRSFGTAMGYYAGASGTTDSQCAFGTYAGYQSTGNTQSVFGIYAGDQNTGAGQTAMGAYAGGYNIATWQTAIGQGAGQWNTGRDQSMFGYNAGRFNVGTFHTAVGSLAGFQNDGNYNTVLGAAAFNAFSLNTGAAKAITSVDHANERVTISGGHSFGANGTYINLKITTTGTLPAGLSAGPHIWKIISSTILECITDAFTDAGSGTHTLTPQNIYENSTALGYNAEPDADNQVVLGDTNVTEVKTSGSLTAAGATLSGNLIIPDGGYIGSVSDTDAFQIEADGDIVLTQDLAVTVDLTVLGNTVLGNAAGDTLDVYGITQIGDGGTTDYIQVSAVGQQTLHGAARVLRSVDFEPGALKKGGVGPGDSTEDSFPMHDYDSTNDESVFVHWEIPHIYASAGEIHLHVEFFVDTAPVGDPNVTWGVEYKKLSIGDNFSFASGTTTVVVNTPITAGTPANDKKIHSSAEIHLTTTGFEPMDVVLIRIFRDANASEAGATDNFGSDARVFNYHLMYLSDKSGEAI